MLNADLWPSAKFSFKHKMGTVYILMMLISLSVISAQSRPINHQIDNRSPEIDPYWYVGRGVRPIGRFGKRQLRSRSSLQPQYSSLLEIILSHMKKQDGLNLDNPQEEESW